jgi:hypothetical protein
MLNRQLVDEENIVVVEYTRNERLDENCIPNKSKKNPLSNQNDSWKYYWGEKYTAVIFTLTYNSHVYINGFEIQLCVENKSFCMIASLG